MLERYCYWVIIVSKVFNISTNDTQKRTITRIVLYGLCIRDQISLEYISKKILKHRSNIRKFLSYKDNNKKVDNRLVNWIYNLYNKN